jgi:succinyl-diaminopimelate desuccinylase
MDDFVFPLMLALDVSSLTMSLVNIASPPGLEGALADSIETALRGLPHLEVERVGDTVIAATNAGHGERVVVAGQLTAGAAGADPLAYVEMGKLFGPARVMPRARWPSPSRPPRWAATAVMSPLSTTPVGGTRRS